MTDSSHKTDSESAETSSAATPTATELSATEQSAVTRDQVIEALKTVEDPELFLDIWFLGLIYSIEIMNAEDDPAFDPSSASQTGSIIKIEMTFTSPMCPAGPLLIDRVKTAVGAIPGVLDVRPVVVFNPPWVPTDEVKALVGLI